MTGFLTSETEKEVEKIKEVYGYDTPDDMVREALTLLEAKKKHDALKAEIQRRLESDEEGIPAKQVFKELRERAAERQQ